MELKTEKMLNTNKGRKGLFDRFRREEDGSLIIFSLFMFVLILWFGGMAVDLMRFETTRAKLQGTLDRAVLAAADLDQTQPPEAVCQDYFEKAGMLQFLESCVVDEGINYRVVTANASAVMPLFFYDLPSVFSSPFNAELSSLTVSGSSTAEERVTDVEVSLVLDVSSSMDSNNRITNLRPAARDFVSTVLANNTNAPNGLITISMIPYSAVVNPGTNITQYLDANNSINRTHDYSSCLLFDDNLFTTTALDLQNTTYGHVSHFGYSGYGSDWPISQPWCFTGNENAIVPHTTNEAALHTAINALEPWGNTAIDMGMKWGIGLLDPSTRNLVTNLAGVSGTGVPSIAAGRPEAHTQADVLKVIVLMTDGENTQQWDLTERFKTGLSFVWFDLDYDTQPIQDTSSWERSIQWTGHRTPTIYTDDRFYWNSGGYRWRDYPSGFSDQNDYVNYRNNNAGVIQRVGQGPTFKNGVRQASWQDLYATFFTNSVNNDMMYNAYYNGAIPLYGGQSWTYGHPGNSVLIDNPDYYDSDHALDQSIVNGTEADTRLSNICAAARAQGIVIYTVAFEAPTGGQTALRDCASSPSYYFDVSGTDISAAFSAIASDIRALKLTQ